MKIKCIKENESLIDTTVGKVYEIVGKDQDGENYFMDDSNNKNFNFDYYPGSWEVLEDTKYDVVNNPKHYQLVEGFEVKDLMKLLLNRIENSDTGFTHFQSSCYKEAMQYFLRFMFKNGQEDIQKGVYYMNEVLKEWENK